MARTDDKVWRVLMRCYECGQEAVVIFHDALLDVPLSCKKCGGHTTAIECERIHKLTLVK